MWRSLQGTCLRRGDYNTIILACQHCGNVDTVNTVGIINNHTSDVTTITVEQCIESSITRRWRNIVRYLRKNFLEPECCVNTTEKVDLWLLTINDTCHRRYTELRILRRTAYIIHFKLIRRLKCWPQSTGSPVSISHFHTNPFLIIPISHSIVTPTLM